MDNIKWRWADLMPGDILEFNPEFIENITSDWWKVEWNRYSNFTLKKINADTYDYIELVFKETYRSNSLYSNGQPLIFGINPTNGAWHDRQTVPVFKIVKLKEEENGS